MEPQWTKQIPSKTICDVYYFIFWIYVALAVLAIVGTIAILVSFKLPKGLSVAVGFQGLLATGITATLALFQYLVCARTLLEGQVGK